MQCKDGCEKCNNIVNEKDIEKLDYWDRDGTIVYDSESNTYGVWIQHDDDYYTGRAFDINYCPICGRKLNADK